MSSDDLKREAARAALGHVEAGMRLGLGTGTTARHLVELLAERVASGLEVVCVPTSEATRAQAERLGIRLATLDEQPEIDLVIDGADEIGPDLALIKGGGGALLREKIVATASARMIVIADASKLVRRLGRFPLPIEVVPFGLTATRRLILREATGLGLSGELVLRRAEDGSDFVTDGGHHILDAHFTHIDRPADLAAALTAIPGVVEHGLFLGIAALACVAGPDGARTLDAHSLLEAIR